MKNDLMRFSVAMPEDLLMRFDKLVARRGLAKNRSEVVRDLVRDALDADECGIPGTDVMATLTIVYNHHESDVQDKLTVIQHSYLQMVVSTTHVHMDGDNCLEVMILKGEASDVQDFANLVFGVKGVKNGGLVTTAIEHSDHEDGIEHGHAHGHVHDHGDGLAHSHDHAHTHDRSHAKPTRTPLA